MLALTTEAQETVGAEIVVFALAACWVLFIIIWRRWDD